MNSASTSVNPTLQVVNRAVQRSAWPKWSAILWGAIVGLLHGYALEPITGMGWGNLVLLVGFNAAVAFLVMSAFIIGRIPTGICVMLFGLIFALPMPSMPGAKLTVVNQTEETVSVRLMRVDKPGRTISLWVNSGAVATHRTAPGDYSEGIQVEFSCAESRLIATIAQLWTNEVAVTKSGIELVAKARNEP